MGIVEKLMERGLEKGEKKGHIEERRTNARRMLEKEYPVADIAEITGLSRDEVEDLQEDDS